MTVLNYVGSRDNVVTANSIIINNCPGLINWDDAVPIYNTELWRILKPGPRGYTDPNVTYTQAQMIAGIDVVALGLQELEYTNDWDPPYVP